MVRQLSRLLEQSHSMFSDSLALMADAGRFPKVHANVASMPIDILCATLNAMTTEAYAANLIKIGDDLIGHNGAHNPRGP